MTAEKTRVCARAALKLINYRQSFDLEHRHISRRRRLSCVSLIITSDHRRIWRVTMSFNSIEAVRRDC